MPDKVQLHISGMSCAACVRRIEEGLRRMPGVVDASVNFASEKAQVEFDPEQTDTGALEAAIHDMGYESIIEAAPGRQEKLTVSVGGMTCAACVRRVEKALGRVGGVTDVSVNLATARATVLHENPWAGTAALAKAVTDAGYEFLGVLTDTASDPVEAMRRCPIPIFREDRVAVRVRCCRRPGASASSAPHLLPVMLRVASHARSLMSLPGADVAHASGDTRIRQGLKIP